MGTCVSAGGLAMVASGGVALQLRRLYEVQATDIRSGSNADYHIDSPSRARFRHAWSVVVLAGSLQVECGNRIAEATKRSGGQDD